ncbi:beta-2-syntrophin-like [Paramacrobiotus metropolitanus]|uniref:beta-2-syntrophin-like n=1 Tax=Paramacrobiotus metropolitanus TaxID=2943436 RepID=UPI002445BCFA|nr:beta-2-syntrophin-like [Paramacrobiotus metropolitanus]
MYYNSLGRTRMPALRNPEPGVNFNAAYVLSQHHSTWIRTILTLEDDALILNFEDTLNDDDAGYPYGSSYGYGSDRNYNHIAASTTNTNSHSRFNFANHDMSSFPYSSSSNVAPPPPPLTSEKRTVKIVKDADSGLGISIKGGKENRMPIVISKIFSDMAAEKTHELHVGDAILSCNGHDLSAASHDDAVTALKQAGNIVILEVQFWREATKRIALNDIGWELSHGFLKSPLRLAFSSLLNFEEAISSPARNLRSDSKVIPLLLCYLSRLVEQSLEADATILLLQSPNLRHSCQLKFADPTNGTSWFNMIHSNIAALNSKLLVQCNRVLPKVLGGSHLAQLGWMAERVYMDGLVQLKPVFAALTERQIMVFDAVPWTKEEWATPSFTCDLLTTRVLYSSSASRQNTLSKIQKNIDLSEPPITFLIRVGTRNGIDCHVFKLETCRDLSSWVKAIIQGTFRAVEVIQEMSWACAWQNHDSKLIVHWENGFTLMSANPSRREIFWQQPFEKLKATADDGKRTLFLEFIDSADACVSTSCTRATNYGLSFFYLDEREKNLLPNLYFIYLN